MATREGKKSAVERKVCAYTPGVRIIRVGGKVKPTTGKMTKRGDS